ncbi:MAG: FAD-dependent oxidoreductase [Actinomycetes bacterium]
MGDSNRISRRRMLGGTAAMAGAGVLAACAPAAPTANPGRRSERRRVVVIGTGFGGSVTALRLAQRGVDVTLVERGQRWPSGQRNAFPRMFGPDRRVSWLSDRNSATEKLFPTLPGTTWQPYAGLLERIPGDGMDMVCAAAVGGGSLPYHGMSVQPRGDLFDRVMPSALDYEQFDSVWYPTVRAMLGATPIPDDVLASARYASSRQFMAAVRAAGLPEATVVPMPIDWDVVRAELRGELPPSITSGDVIYGVNGPGKRSLDTNYLPAAESTGHVELLPLHKVDRFHRDGAGRWVVDTERIDTDGNVQEYVELTTDALFLCAGSPNTTKLLVRAAALGDVPDLPEDVGAWWSTNGDLLTSQILSVPTGTYQGGPASIGSFDWDNPAGPVTVLYAPLPLEQELNFMQVIGIFIPDGHGRFNYDARSDQARLTFPASAHGAALAEARRRVARVAAAAGAVASIDMTEVDPSTYHALGGAVIGKVCDDFGRVLGQRGLYVNDGALIPGSTACANPSLTIAALAERNADHIVRNDVDSVF